MVSSNECFKLSGDRRGLGKNLKLYEAVSYIIKGLDLNIKAYKIENGCFYMYYYGYIYESEKVIEIKKEDSKNINFISLLIETYLYSSDYESAIQTTINDWDGADGSSHYGWSMEIDTNNDVIVIKPFWTFYHK